jgi:hypothetical protein
MNEPFVFRKVLYLVESTGRRARTLDQLLRGVTVVPPVSIGYHMHREYLEVRIVEPQWPNDFAYFCARVLGDEVLAEKLSALRVFKYRALEALQLDLARMLAEHLEEVPQACALEAPQGREFNFSMARAIVTNCQREARNVKEFISALEQVEPSAIYYHLFETRFFGGEGRANDFAVWFKESLGLPELAHRLEAFDPYMFSLEGARKALLRIVTDAARRQEVRA